MCFLGNVYASAGKWRDKARVRESMNKRGLVKPLGSTKIEIDGVIHEFAAEILVSLKRKQFTKIWIK